MSQQCFLIALSSCRLTESPYKVVLEQLVGLEPSTVKTSEEEEEESQAVLQRPLEICLKHSTVLNTDGSDCPLVRPQSGVAALHEYAEWITELNDKRGDTDRKKDFLWDLLKWWFNNKFIPVESWVNHNWNDLRTPFRPGSTIHLVWSDHSEHIGR